MVNRPTAPDRMRRVLAVVPWIVANPGRTVHEVATRFGLSNKELLDDLNVVYYVGLPPYSPDALIDVDIDDEGRVTIRLADFFSKPLRLTPGQGLALLASSDALLSVPGTDPGGALARALGKLRASLGAGAAEALDVHLGEAEGDLLDQLRSAAAAEGEVEITYYSYGRDDRSVRAIAPWRVFADSGAWYVQAWCHRAGAERVFRVDRIEGLRPLPAPAGPDPGAPAGGGTAPGATGARPAPRPPASAGEEERSRIFQPGADDPRVRIRLDPAAAWVADAYPVEVLHRAADGGLDVELVITAVPWLERLLIRLGPAATVLGQDGLDDAAELAARAASRILARYLVPTPTPTPAPGAGGLG